MKKIISISALLLCIFCLTSSSVKHKSYVDKYGHLSVEGNKIVDENGAPVQLRGMSFFWSQWQGKYYNPAVVKWLSKNWNCSIVRAAMGVEKGGYLTNPYEEQLKLETVIRAAIKNGVYVIIDYHAHHAHDEPEKAAEFFGKMAKKYGKHPNIIYETFNEPLEENWSTVLKPYHEKIIAAIRKHDPDNLIICGTRTWSQRVDEASLDPIEGKNIAYTLHYYASTHKQELRDIAKVALDRGIPLFITEFGICEASGDGYINEEEYRAWWDFCDEHHISWCNWSVSDKIESASVIKPNANEYGRWTEDELTRSGKIIREELKKNSLD